MSVFSSMSDSVWDAAAKRNEFINTWRPGDDDEYSSSGQCEVCDTTQNLLYITCDTDHHFIACDKCARMCDTCTITFCASHRFYSKGAGFSKCSKCDAQVCDSCLRPKAIDRFLRKPKHKCKSKKSHDAQTKKDNSEQEKIGERRRARSRSPAK